MTTPTNAEALNTFDDGQTTGITGDLIDAFGYRTFKFNEDQMRIIRAALQDKWRSDIEKRVISAAVGVVAADTYVHPMLSRQDAVAAGVAELHDAVNAYQSTQVASAAAPPVDGEK